MRTHLVVATIAVAAAAGVIGDILLRSSTWGLNFSIWVTLIAAAALVLTAQEGRNPLSISGLQFAVAILFAACVAWRDSPRLKGWNVLATGLAFALTVLGAQGVRLSASAPFRLLQEAFASMVSAVVGPVALGVDGLHISGEPNPRIGRQFAAALIGVIVAVPILVVFGSLLTSADPVFERLMRSLIHWDLRRILSHVFVFAILAWFTAGYLRALVEPRRIAVGLLQDLHAPKLGILEIGIPLGALTVLFLTFVVVQFRYLFGGEEIIRQAVDLSYAEYARRGFFELIVVAGLVLPLLLASDGVLERDSRAVSIFRGMAGAQLLLVGLIAASAFARLQLYRQAYGLTASRLHAAAVLLWLTLSLAWFAATVLRGRRNRFPVGAVVSGFAVLALLNLSNPDAIVARANLARATAGGDLDVEYLRGLSADAVPDLLRGSHALSMKTRCEILHAVKEDADAAQESDWRAWSVSRSRARRTVASLAPEVAQCENRPRQPL